MASRLPSDIETVVMASKGKLVMAQSEAEEILMQRLADGKISVEEYDRRLAKLKAAEAGDRSAIVRSGPRPGQRAVRVNPGKPRSPMLVMPQQQIISPSVKELWRGHQTLPSTFWLWGCIGTVVAIIIVAVIISAGRNTSAYSFGIGLFLSWAAFISICLMRSSEVYKVFYPERSALGKAAQIGVITALILISIVSIKIMWAITLVAYLTHR